MLTIEEAIHWCLDCFYVQKDDWEKVLEARQILREAAERQIPKKPIKNYYYAKTYYYENWCCPICERFLIWSDAKPKIDDSYCVKCGQRIDWSDD